MNAIIYTRFSPRRNADQSESCEIQEALCREHAKAQGMSIKAVYTDRGVSGRTADRPGLTSALGALRHGDVLLVYKRDRLARNVLIAELTKRQVKAVRATITAVSGDIAGDDSNPSVVLGRQIIDAVAEFERKQIAARTRDAMQQHQRNGRRMSRYAPYGWSVSTRDSTKLVVDPFEQAVIRSIRDFAADGMSIAEIRNRLNGEVRGFARADEWSYNAVRRILVREEISVKMSDEKFHLIKKR